MDRTVLATPMASAGCFEVTAESWGALVEEQGIWE